MSQKMILECTDLEESIARGAADYDIEELIADLARTSDDEFDDLVRMYHKAEPSLYKIRLATTLVMLDCRDIIPDLLNFIKSENKMHRFFCAFLLVELNEEAGALDLLALNKESPTGYTALSISHEMDHIKTDVAQKYADTFYQIHLSSLEKSEAKDIES